MSSRNRSRALALILSVVPGWGHIYWGRERIGLGIFTVFTLAFFVLFNGLFLYIGSGGWLLVRGSLIVLVGSVLGGWVDIYRRTAPERLREEEACRDRWIREGMIEYLRGDIEAARTSFRTCIRSDPLDVDALFGLGMACSRAGESGAAKAWLRRARRYDEVGKWNWEIREELRRIRERAPSVRTSGVAADDRGKPVPVAAGKKTG